MNIIDFVNNNLINRARQYGLWRAILQIISIIFRPVYRITHVVVLAIPNHNLNTYRNEYNEVEPITKNTIETFNKNGIFDRDTLKLFCNFIFEDCEGYAYYNEDELAGYIFIQNHDKYNYVKYGNFKIPDNIAVIKNLFVYPKYRGKSVSKKLIHTAISSISTQWIPVTFVILENRYAIRNFKMFGFQEIAIISIITLFRKWTKQIINKVQCGDISNKIIDGLKLGADGKVSVYNKMIDKRK